MFLTQGRQVIHLHPQDALGGHSLAQQLLDDLQLQDGLAHLPRSAQQDKRRRSLLHLVEQ